MCVTPGAQSSMAAAMAASACCVASPATSLGTRWCSHPDSAHTHDISSSNALS